MARIETEGERENKKKQPEVLAVAVSSSGLMTNLVIIAVF